FDHSGLTRSRRTEEKQVTNWPARHVHSRQVDLVHVDNALNGAILPYDFSQQPAFEVQYFGASHLRIKEYFFGNERFDHCFAPLAGLSQACQDTLQSGS